jgi:hypothetical protein
MWKVCFLIGGISLCRGIYLLLRVSSYRIDRPTSGGRFGVPYFWNSKYWHKKNFRAEGHAMLRQLQVSAIVTWVFGVLGLVSLP